MVKRWNVDLYSIITMKLVRTPNGSLGLAITLCLLFRLTQAQPLTGRSWSNDPRVQSRSYVFTNTGEAVLIMVGEKDGFIGSVQRLDERMKSLNIPHEYKEVPGKDHGGIIMGAMPEVFAFFGRHTKP